MFFFFQGAATVLLWAAVAAAPPSSASLHRHHLAPLPAVQTPRQAAFMKALRPAAQNASAGAEAALAAFLDTPSFRASWQQACPACDAGLLALPGVQLVAKFQQELSVAEYVHNFPSARPDAPTPLTDMDIYDCLNKSTPYFFSQWELFASGRRTYESLGPPSFPNPVDVAEQELFDCPPIANLSNVTWDEALERPLYAAMNWFKFDDGNGNFGDVSIVFKQSYIRQLGFMSPIDTGMFEMWCNPKFEAFKRGQAPIANCSAWNGKGLGTVDDFTHMILPSAHFWNGSAVGPYGNQTAIPTPAHERLGVLFARTFGRWAPNLTSTDPKPTVPLLKSEQILRYPELDLAGQAFFPDSLKFIIGNFGTTFGSAHGTLVRNWAAEYNWTLIWALGNLDYLASSQMEAVPSPEGIADMLHFGVGASIQHTPNASYRYLANQRVLDPFSLTQTNFSASDAVKDNFANLWDHVQGLRSESVNRTISVEQAVAAWDEVDHSLFVEPLRFGACAAQTAADNCVGTTVVDGDCVCYTQ